MPYLRPTTLSDRIYTLSSVHYSVVATSWSHHSDGVVVPVTSSEPREGKMYPPLSRWSEVVYSCPSHLLLILGTRK